MGYKLKIGTWNANGLKGRQGQLKNFLDSNNVDILLINETKFSNRDKFKIRYYQVIRADRDNHGGGVAAIIKNSIPHLPVTLGNTTLETTAFRLTDNTHIIAAYNRPLNHFTDADLQTLTNTANKVLIIGDLNARHTHWNCHRNNRNGNTLNDFADNNNLGIMFPDTHTHYPNNNTTPTTLDIIINKNVTHITQPHAVQELDSDHNPVFITLTNQTTQSTNKTITSYKNTDWAEFRKTLDEHITLTPNIATTERLEDEVRKLTAAITTTKQRHAQTKSINPNKDDLPAQILQTIRRRNQTRKTWQRTADLQAREELMQLNRQVKREINTHKNEKWTNLLESLSPKDNTLWRLTKAFKRAHNPIPALVTNNGTALTDLEKADTLADAFEDVHRIDEQDNTQEQQDIINFVDEFIGADHLPGRNILTKIITSPREIRNIIKYLPRRKAPGPDNIDNTLVKSLTRKATVQLTYIINAILKLNHFPSAWKSAHIIPIPKPNKLHSNPSNYRPISLLNTLAKLTEKIILIRLNNFDRKHKITADCQFGFRAKHNTTQQVVRIVNDITTNYNKDKVTVMTLLDIQKAFDTVWITGLLHKLITMDFPPNLIKLIHTYLTNRQFSVKINNAYSNTKHINAGVPQGSVLGPRLFTLYINDLPQFQKTRTALYADDTAIYAHSFSATVANVQLQLHMNKITQYYTKWKIKINPEKTEQIIFTRKYTNNRILTPLKVNDHNITPSDAVKYLGVNLDRRLNYQTHITNTIRKAYAVMKTLYPILRDHNTSTKNKKLIYTTILRPLLTYAAPVWCNASNPTINKLQVFQNKCLRLATNTGRYIRITDLHDLAEIETIKDFIYRTSQVFYQHQLKHNNLTQHITEIRAHNTTLRLKHKLPYQTLPLFTQQ